MKTSRWPISHLPISGVTPFTYRDDETYLSMLNRLAQYVTDQLHPDLRNTVEEIVEEMEHILAAQHTKYVDGIQDFQSIHDAFMTDVNSALMSLNDSTVADLVDDPGSVFGTTIRELFASRQDFEGVSDDVSFLRDTTQVASTQNTNIYVEKNGDDNHDGLTTQRPVATLTRVVELLPDVIHRGHIYTVHIGIGQWDERLTLRDIMVHGELYFQGTTLDEQVHRIESFRGINITGHTSFRYLKFIREDGASMWFERCSPHMIVENCDITDTGSDTSSEGNHAVLADYGSQVMVRRTVMSGKRYALRSNYLSRIFSYDNTGHGNVFAVGARWGGIISAAGTMPDAETIMTNTSGGLVVFNQGGKIGIPDGEHNSLMEQWGNKPDGSPHKRFYTIRSNNSGVNDDITPGGRLRLRIERENNGPVSFDVQFMGSPTTSNAHSFHGVFAGHFGTSTFNPKTVSVIRSFTGSNSTDNYMTIEDVSPGIIDIIIEPISVEGQSYNAGWWGVDLTVSMFRGQTAPRLVSVDLI